MVGFDWRAFCERHHIEYVERGPSTAKGNIYIRCPLCGQGDQGHHMGLHLKSAVWGCWRNSNHRGKAPQRLIKALLGCSWGEALAIAGEGAKAPPSSDAGLLGAVRGALGYGSGQESARPPLSFPDALHKLRSQGPPEAYLKDRGWKAKQLSDIYDLRWAWEGEWSYRITIPVYDWDRSLLTWTARSIVSSEKLRYKSLTTDPNKAQGGPIARVPISDCLLNLPWLKEGGDTLVLTEGFFDQAALNRYRDFDFMATCLFGKIISPGQLDLLSELRPKFRKIFLLLDPDAIWDSLRIGSELQALGVIPMRVKNDNDPGEMPEKEARALIHDMVERRA